MSVKMNDIDLDTRCADNGCPQRETCERFLPDGHVYVTAQIAGTLRARWQDNSSVCLHYVERGAVS